MPSTFTDKHGLPIWTYILVKNPWEEGKEADVVALNEQDHLVLLDLHDDGGPTGFRPEELEILETDMEKRLIQRSQVIERRQNDSLVGMVNVLAKKSRQHAYQYKDAVPSTLALFDALETYLKAQLPLYEQMSKKRKELFYPCGTISEIEISRFFAAERIFAGISHEPHGDDPDVFDYS